MHGWFGAGLLLLGALLAVSAMRNLARHASGGSEIALGSASSLASQWLPSSAVCGAGLVTLLVLNWVWAAAFALGLYFITAPI